MKIFLILASLLAVGCAPDPGPTNDDVGTRRNPSNFGNCSAPVDLRLDPDGRRAQLLADVIYTDSKGSVWRAPKGHVVDGASIPRAFWRVIGGPWEGKYRFASVVHDVACDEKKRGWDDAAKMFYEAMRCSGVTERQAKVMYYAVYKFGPQWGPSARAPRVKERSRGPEESQGTLPPPATDEDVERVLNFVDTMNPTLQQIETEASRR